MKEQLLNTTEDCNWLSETHLVYFPGDVPHFNSFILLGNEDSPEGIALYEAVMPSLDDTSLLKLWESDGRYREMDEDETFPPGA